MSFFSWFKGLFVENENTVELPEDLKEEIKQGELKDYKLKIFELNNRDDLNQVTSFIVQDKSLAIIKMYKFTGDHDSLKKVLDELKQICDNCNSKIFGVTNNMFLVVKNSVEVLK